MDQSMILSRWITFDFVTSVYQSSIEAVSTWFYKRGININQSALFPRFPRFILSRQRCCEIVKVTSTQFAFSTFLQRQANA